jgi:hypothetical protein
VPQQQHQHQHQQILQQYGSRIQLTPFNNQVQPAPVIQQAAPIQIQPSRNYVPMVNQIQQRLQPNIAVSRVVNAAPLHHNAPHPNENNPVTPPRHIYSSDKKNTTD